MGLPTEVERRSSERFAESEQEFWTQTLETCHPVEATILKLMNSMPFDIFDFPTLPAAKSQQGVKSQRDAIFASFCQFLILNDFGIFMYLLYSSIIFSNPRVLLRCSCATVLDSQPLNVGEEEPLLSALTCQDHGSSLDRQSHSHFNWTSPTNPKKFTPVSIMRLHTAHSKMTLCYIKHVFFFSNCLTFDMLPQCTHMIE